MKVVLVLVLLLLSGCLQPASRTQGQPPPRYSWGFYYPPSDGSTQAGFVLQTGRRLQEFTGWHDEAGVHQLPAAGTLSEGSRKGFSYGLRPIPEKVRVTWRRWELNAEPQSGPRRSQDVLIRARVRDPEHFDGTIWLVYFGEAYGWTAEPVPSSPLVLVGDQQREKPIEQRVAEGLVKRPPPLQSTTRPAAAEEGGER